MDIRDILVKCGVTSHMTSQGTVLTFPDGTVLKPPSGTFLASTQMLLRQDNSPDAPSAGADIFCGLLDVETLTTPGVMLIHGAWRPWISAIRPYVPPPDPSDCTLNYTRMPDLVYQEDFENQEGNSWQLLVRDTFVGPEGVAAGVSLTEEQLS